MKNFTINYNKYYWNDWTVYNQLITIDKEMKNKYNEYLKLEYDRINFYKNLNKTINNRDMDILCFTNELNDWINYLKLTWLYHLSLVLHKFWYYSKRKILDRNTMVYVK